MPGCCIKNCRRGSGKDRRGPQGNKVSLFYFPKDPKLREQWFKACQWKEGELKLSCAAVCDRHFLPVCFEDRWTEQRSKNQRRIIRRLKDDAIPTELLTIPEQTVKRLKMTREKSSCKTGIPSYNELVNYAPSTGLDNNADSLPSCAPSTSKTMDIGMDSDSFPRPKINPSEVVEVIQNFDDPPNKMNELLLRLKKVEEEKQQLAAANLKLSIKMQQLEQENCQLKDNCQTERIAYDALQLVFTPGQVKKLMSPHITRINWTAEDISSAIALKAVSGKAYDYLRIVKKIPLPCVQTLRNWSANFNVQPGLLEDVLQIMQSKGKTLSVINKLTVLSFDEVYISNKIDLDRRLQKIVGPHKTCQFVMARALFGNWRQPIFFNYDQPMTKEILLDIIKHLQEADYTVVAVTSDMGPTNMRLWKSMNIGVEIQNNRNPQLIGQCEEKKCYFSHPMDQTMKIFVFADVPHLMKLARNNLFDSGFFIDGKLITKDILEHLVTLNSDELKIAFNLTKVHLDAKGNQRQSVKLAAQVFSRRNAKAIEYCAKKRFLTNENWQETANLLQLFNDWFDILNCQSKFENRKGIKTYGVELEQQDAVLNKMSEVISSMRSPKRSTMLPFQKGILLSTESLRQLLRYVKDKYSTDEYNIQYIITRRLNQDILENFFSYLRAMGAANDHPSPVELQHRIKWYILGKHSEHALCANKNTENDTATSFMDIEDVHASDCISDSLATDEEVQLTKEAQLFMTFEDSQYAEASKHANIRVKHFDEEEDDEIEEKQIICTIPIFNAELQLLEEFEKIVASEVIESEALIYVAGYVAHRFRHKYPDLGTPTKNLPPTDGWLSIISKGNCIYPSNDFQAAAVIMNEDFVKFHGQFFNRESHIFDKLTKIVLNKVTFPVAVISCLVRTRTYIRLRHINAIVKQQNCEKKDKKKKKHMYNKIIV